MAHYNSSEFNIYDMKTFIYTLTNPINNEILYVGKSNYPNKRYYGHLGESKRGKESHKCDCIREILSNGQKPTLNIIEECDMSIWRKREVYWINKLQPDGNQYQGGGGAGIRYYKQPSKIVLQYDLEMNFIKEYESINEAARQTGLDIGNLSNACNGKINHHGYYIWRIKGKKYPKKDKIIKKSVRQSRKVSKYTKDDILVKTYNSISDAVAETNIPRTSISNCCFYNKVELKSSAYGYKWQFVDKIYYI